MKIPASLSKSLMTISKSTITFIKMPHKSHRAEILSSAASCRDVLFAYLTTVKSKVNNDFTYVRMVYSADESTQKIFEYNLKHLHELEDHFKIKRTAVGFDNGCIILHPSTKWYKGIWFSLYTFLLRLFCGRRFHTLDDVWVVNLSQIALAAYSERNAAGYIQAHNHMLKARANCKIQDIVYNFKKITKGSLLNKAEPQSTREAHYLGFISFISTFHEASVKIIKKAIAKDPFILERARLRRIIEARARQVSV